VGDILPQKGVMVRVNHAVLYGALANAMHSATGVLG